MKKMIALLVMAMMLFSAVAFIQDNKFFSSSKASC